MRKVKKPIIIYPRGVVQKLAVSMNIPERSVRAALRYETNSETAKAIRSQCVKFYGGRVSDTEVV